MQSADDTEAQSLPSCVGCRTRKLKCSREKPSCTNCRRLDLECAYSPQKTKPGLKRGTVEKLSQRIEYLERKLLGREDAGPDGAGDEPSEGENGPQRQSTDTSSVLTALTLEIQRLSSSISSLSGTIPSTSSTYAPHGASDGDVESRNPKRRRISGSGGQSNARNASAPAPIRTISSPESLHGLLDAYFMNVHPWIPMIHRETFWRRIQSSGGNAGDQLILHGMLIGASRHLRHEGLSAQDAQEEVDQAVDHVVLNANQGLALENLQALIIVAFTHVGDGELSKAWPIIASLTRTVEFLRLSVEDDDEAEGQPESFLGPAPLPRPADWAEEEERRRVFWNIFILDRICAITAGWNNGLTADNVSRRLPICGTYWNNNRPGVAPVFGIWDKSAANISNSVAFLPSHYPSPKHARESGTDEGDNASDVGHLPGTHIDAKTIGAFAYFVESLESLSRINVYFLRQKIDFRQRQEVSNWLTRFKELDLRLVHWKMFLPPKWKDPAVPPPETATILDPNMSLAHVTHNTSMILLHQQIGYPEPEMRDIRLPNVYSAETCQYAAIETSNITRNYLSRSAARKPLSPHWAFCTFVSAKVLLVHHRFYGVELSSHFGVLVKCLTEMADRWTGSRPSSSRPSLAGRFADELQHLHKRLHEDAAFVIKVMSPLRDPHSRSLEGNDEGMRNDDVAPAINVSSQRDGDPVFPSVPHRGRQASTVHTSLGEKAAAADWKSPSNSSESRMSTGSRGQDELSNILSGLTDEGFMGMDRVISLEDLNFELLDGGAFGEIPHTNTQPAWSPGPYQWAAEQSRQG